MTEMPYHTQRRLQEAVTQAVRDKVADFFQEEIEAGEKLREQTRANRRASLSQRSEGWVEDYAVRIEHNVTVDGRGATVSVPGCPIYVTVGQTHGRPLWDRYTGRKNRSKNPLRSPHWTVKLYNNADDSDEIVVDLTEQFGGTDFEAVLQQSVILMLANAYTRSTL